MINSNRIIRRNSHVSKTNALNMKPSNRIFWQKSINSKIPYVPIRIPLMRKGPSGIGKTRRTLRQSSNFSRPSIR